MMITKKFTAATFLTFVAILFLGHCSKPKSTAINRDWSMDPDTQMGYIYGKLVHNNLYGKSFKLTLKDLKTGGKAEIKVESYGDPHENYFIELKPGEWILDKIIDSNQKEIVIHSLQKKEHKEFIVEKADIIYTGSWIFSDSSLTVKDEKEQQDSYMRINYKYVLTTNSLTLLP